MKKDFETWQFIGERLSRGQPVMLLVVAESSGSSPGRAGYKMAVAADGELMGSIGGGVMEVNLVEQSRAVLSGPGAAATGFRLDQVHRANALNSSGMICSGRQTVIFRLLDSDDLPEVEKVIAALVENKNLQMVITSSVFELRQAAGSHDPISFELLPDNDFRYVEQVETTDRLIIIGGGHCALALSEVMSRLGFHISIFDDRPELNTIEKNRFADSVTIVETYENIGAMVPSGGDVFVVVMTLGYASDQQVIRALIGKDFWYFGVLGSRAKVATMFRELRNEGLDQARLSLIRSPIGLPVNSRTPEEIAVSIAAEIIAVKNGALSPGQPEPFQ